MFTLTGCTGDRFYLQVVEYLLDGLSAISSWHEFYIIYALRGKYSPVSQPSYQQYALPVLSAPGRYGRQEHACPGNPPHFVSERE